MAIRDNALLLHLIFSFNNKYMWLCSPVASLARCQVCQIMPFYIKEKNVEVFQPGVNE